MIKITVIAMGKIKEKYFNDAIAEYTKRLSRYCDIKTVEIPPVNISENPNENEISSALQREATLIEKQIPKNSLSIALCVEGKSLSSEGLADVFKENINIGKNICFIIGSSYGLSRELKEKCDMRLSMSEMTFPHRLFRVMLFEQIYRSFKISEGGNYHK